MSQIIDEASHWLITMREPSVSQEDRAAFAEWLRTSPVHVGAYLEVTKLWADAAHLDHDLPADFVNVSPPNVVQLREKGESLTLRGEVPHAARGPRRHRRKQTRIRRLGIAASVALALVGSFFTWQHYTANTYTTDIGEQRVITLEDSSVVRLNSRSRLQVHMTKHERAIELSEGQALFEVAHDASRPFIVRSDDVTVRAVGTQFDVNQKHSGTVVTVVQGRVKVDAVHSSGFMQFFPIHNEVERASDSAPVAPAAPNLVPNVKGSSAIESDAHFVSAGEQVRVARNGTVQKAEKTDTSVATSWLQQELRFEGQPLSDVLEEFSRYTHVHIELSDPTLANLRINAVFHTTNPDSLLNYLAHLDGVKVERSEKEIRISRRP